MPEQFLTLSPRELYEALKDHQDRERVTLEEQVKATYNAARLVGMWVFNFTPVKKKVMTDPQKLCRFPWDKAAEKPNLEKMTPKQQRMYLRQIANSFK